MLSWRFRGCRETGCSPTACTREASSVFAATSISRGRNIRRPLPTTRAAVGILKDGAEKIAARYSMGVAELRRENPTTPRVVRARRGRARPARWRSGRACNRPCSLPAWGTWRRRARRSRVSSTGIPQGPGVEQATRLLAELLEQGGDGSARCDGGTRWCRWIRGAAEYSFAAARRFSSSNGRQRPSTISRPW